MRNPTEGLIWYDDVDDWSEDDETVRELIRMKDRLRTLRSQLCEPKNNTNPRYHALSLAISGLNRAVADIENEYLD